MIELISSIQWRQPMWFALIFLPILLWFVIQWLKSKFQQQFADKHLLKWITVNVETSLWQKIFSRDTAYFLAWAGFALAMAGPRLAEEISSDPSKSQLDIMLVIDLSQSMQATDIKPSRIRRATLEAYEFLSILKSARVGVVVYAARPHLFVPPSIDKSALEFYLNDLDTLVLPTQGSDPVAAIRLAQTELSKLSHSNSKHIIWITDGDLEEAQYAPLNTVLKQESIITHGLVIASGEGVGIPTKEGTWLTEKGRSVITHHDFDRLSKTFKKRGGVLSLVNDDESDWQAIYHRGILPSVKSNNSDNQEEQWQELFPWFLVPALLLFFFALYPSARTFLIVSIIASLLAVSNTFADEPAQKERHLKQLYNGANAYKESNYLGAKSAFIQAMLSAESDQERGMALHNLGNSLFQIGDYKGAMVLYQDALRHNPALKQSAKNLALSDELHQLLTSRMKPPQGGNGVTSNNLLTDMPNIMPASATTRAVNISIFTLPKLPKGELNTLLKKGLAHLQLLQSSQAESKASIKEKQNINEARQHLLSLEEENSTSSALWKRLFEIEEGFPGSLDKPEEIPGVRPW